MAFIQREKLSTRDLIAGSFAVLGRNWRLIALLLAVLFALFFATDVSPAPADAILATLTLVAFFAGEYLLFQAMLREERYSPVGDRLRIFRFVGLAIMVSLGVSLAMNLLVIPGIILGARWIMAPSFLIASERGAFASLGESWSATSGNTLAISLAATALIALVFLMLVVAGAFEEMLPWRMMETVSVFILYICPSVLLMGLSVAVFERLSTEGAALSDVFE